jgi:UDP-2,3-diacylglucosamine pyrophosphatase LpxH
MKFEEFFKSFVEFAAVCPAEELREGAKYVFLSDLHLGNGGGRDDLRRNRALVLETLAMWYAERDYTLVLNGDIEDLNKFRLMDIVRAWPGFFGILDDFASRGRLRKIVGNHDLDLVRERGYPYALSHGLLLTRGDKRIFAFHGHQASRFFVDYDYVSRFIVRYVAKPLKIRNSSVSEDSRHRFKTERRIYRASRKLGILSITGHTHRPLFESLSKYESVRWSAEEAIREYASADGPRREEISSIVAEYKAELGRLSDEGLRDNLARSLYEDRDFLIPCLFNSGCATGRNGYTAIEIIGDSIELVHWGDADKCRRYMGREAIERDRLEGFAWTRQVLRRSRLDDVFARVELLGRLS